MLKDRSLIKIGTPDEVISPRRMKQVYGVDVEIITMGNGMQHKVCVPMIGARN